MEGAGRGASGSGTSVFPRSTCAAVPGALDRDPAPAASQVTLSEPIGCHRSHGNRNTYAWKQERLQRGTKGPAKLQRRGLPRPGGGRASRRRGPPCRGSQLLPLQPQEALKRQNRLGRAPGGGANRRTARSSARSLSARSVETRGLGARKGDWGPREEPGLRGAQLRVEETPEQAAGVLGHSGLGAFLTSEGTKEVLRPGQELSPGQGRRRADQQ